MNTLIRSLLGGAAIGALASAPALSQQHYRLPLSITAMHAGRAANKTQRYHCHHLVLGYSVCKYSIFTYAHASDLHRKVPLLGTFYKYNSNGDLCSNPKQNIVAWKKSDYAKIYTVSMTYYEGCSGQQPTFYGDDYKLTNKDGVGKYDFFESMLRGVFSYNGKRYRGQMVLDVTVTIDADQPAGNSN